MKAYRTFRITLEYDGSNYSGWQRQRGAVTIQQVIEEVLGQLFQQKITIEGSGRTDAGVHAFEQVASFRVDAGHDKGILKRGARLDRARVMLALNSLLPRDIVVTGIREVPASFHARHSAKRKRYSYYILNRRHGSALLRDRCHFYPRALDLRRMRSAAKVLVGEHSFRAFASESFKEKSYVRNLSRLTIRREGEFLRFTFEANGFLYNMIRNIVGTLLEAGRGKLSAADVRRILEGERRKDAGPKVPPQGLYLERVFY